MNRVQAAIDTGSREGARAAWTLAARIRQGEEPPLEEDELALAEQVVLRESGSGDVLVRFLWVLLLEAPVRPRVLDLSRRLTSGAAAGMDDEQALTAHTDRALQYRLRHAPEDFPAALAQLGMAPSSTLRWVLAEQMALSDRERALRMMVDALPQCNRWETWDSIMLWLFGGGTPGLLDELRGRLPETAPESSERRCLEATIDTIEAGLRKRAGLEPDR